ncbi:hypothetical protein T492DRAFT_844497 [Pavlovales sp. CCMP2436]|nr:hypothetical protein T492DRAFT_844497 [Pavlovales sp. CCMP2436]
MSSFRQVDLLMSTSAAAFSFHAAPSLPPAGNGEVAWKEQKIVYANSAAVLKFLLQTQAIPSSTLLQQWAANSLPALPDDIPPGCRGIAPASAIKLVDDWCKRELEDTHRRLRGESGRRNLPLVLSANEYSLQPGSNVIYDLRGAPPYYPLRIRSVRRGIDGEAFARAVGGPAFADQALLAYLRMDGGVLLRADIDLQVVLLPGLLSLGNDVFATARDAEKLVAAGFIFTSDMLPFWPMRVNPQGLAAKRDGDGWRRICDGGAPRQLFFDADGTPVISLNDASNIDGFDIDGTRRFPHERKPTTTQLATDLAVLARCAHVLGERVYGCTFDFAKFFYQFNFRGDECWKVNFVSPDSSGSALRFHTELFMSMGLSPSSGIVQRFSSALMRHIAATFEVEETPILAALSSSSPGARRLFEASAKISTRLDCNCARLFTGLIYTDDGAGGAVGAGRMIRLAQRILEVCLKFNVSVAHAKCHLGQLFIWLGIGYALSLNLVFVPVAKILRATGPLSRILSGELTTFGDLHQLARLLEHFRSALKLSAMIYPGAYVLRTAAPANACKRWLDLLGSQAAASFVPLTDAAQPQLTAAPLLHIYSDAAQDEDGSAGLCGFMHGYWWAFRIFGLPPGLIAQLEFVAFLISVMVFNGLIIAPVCFHCDNSVVTAVINSASSSEEFIQAVHVLLASLPEWPRIARVARVKWLPSKANAFADAGSRALLARLQALCTASGIRSTRLVPPDVDGIIASIFQHSPRLPPYTPSYPPFSNPPDPADGVRFGEARVPGPPPTPPTPTTYLSGLRTVGMAQVEGFCAEMHINIWRPPGGNLEHDARLELQIMLAFLIHSCDNMKPRCHSDPAPKPASAFSNVFAIRRIHERSGINLVDFSLLSRVVKGMEIDFVRKYGSAALIPSRKKPIFLSHLARFRLAAAGKYINSSTVDWSDPYWIVIWRALITLFYAGFRKSDALSTRTVPFSRGRMTRASLSWQGVIAVLMPGTSKADQTGTFWGDEPICLPTRRTNDPLDPGACLAAVERAVPVAPEQAASTPLFALPGSAELAGETFSNVLSAHLRCIMSAEEAADYSGHSFRIGAATKLLARGTPSDVIKRTFRWRANVAQLTYSRVDSGERCALADAMRAQHVGSAPALFESEGRVAALLDGACE